MPMHSTTVASWHFKQLKKSPSPEMTHTSDESFTRQQLPLASNPHNGLQSETFRNTCEVTSCDCRSCVLGNWLEISSVFCVSKHKYVEMLPWRYYAWKRLMIKSFVTVVPEKQTYLVTMCKRTSRNLTWGVCCYPQVAEMKLWGSFKVTLNVRK